MVTILWREETGSAFRALGLCMAFMVIEPRYPPFWEVEFRRCSHPKLCLIHLTSPLLVGPRTFHSC